MLKTVTNQVNVSQITGVLPVANGGTGVTTSTGTGNTVLSAAPTLSGNVSLSTGNLVIGTSGRGIDFSANPNPGGMTSELLNDYEEGTFTPVFNIGATNQNIGGLGTYAKIGRFVYFQIGFFGESYTESGSGDITISGLPFTSIAEAFSRSFAGCAAFQGTNTTTIFGLVGSNSTTIFMRKSGVNNSVALTGADLSTSTVIIQVSGSYQAA